VLLGRTQAWHSFRSTRGTRMVFSCPRHQSISETKNGLTHSELMKLQIFHILSSSYHKPHIPVCRKLKEWFQLHRPWRKHSSSCRVVCWLE
jgi:hypothetical protein